MLTAEELEARYAYDTAQLADHYEGVFTPEEVREAVAVSREHLEKQASVTDFLPLLVSRMAKEELLAKAQAEGRVAKALPEILFVSENNSARSHMAAALTRHLADGKVNVRCAGLHPRGGLSSDVITVLAERGITLKYPYPMPFTSSLVGAADVVVTLGVPEFHDFAGKSWVNWEVPSLRGEGLEFVREVADDLERRIRALLADEVRIAA
ncbi:low molecular weight phosphatase family protein [Raineyella sp. LH-20]|uniref:arsenate-mycothiol transferase ArsC n=1 Tax=Raineyella sp. LH-20 TaxID=3081204 RepID=UPI002954CCEA|nr:arsenate reductase ArsC [Raineyella sp. LH-20]WOP19059.1 arsenate reductase ArsC [Raineyella sp. LH-20]